MKDLSLKVISQISLDLWDLLIIIVLLGFSVSLLGVCHFPIGILGQVWYLIVSIPDLCTLTYFTYIVSITTSFFFSIFTDINVLGSKFDIDVK